MGGVSGRYPIRFFTSSGCSRTSKPATLAVPDEGGRKHVSMRMVVVLPAPLGPRKPTICPFATSKEISSTAVVLAYLLVSRLTVIMNFCCQRGATQPLTPHQNTLGMNLS